MRKCEECGGEMVTRKETIHFPASGLDSVWLLGVDVARCKECKEWEADIPHTEALQRAIVLAVVSQPGRLSGAEVRFLRKLLGYNGELLAHVMGVTPSSVSRWENNKEPVGLVSDRLLRVMALRQFGVGLEEFPTEQLGDVGLEGGAKVDKLELELVSGRWRAR